MKILHALRPMLSWKYVLSIVGTYLKRGETTHLKFCGQNRSLSIYLKGQLQNTSTPNLKFKRVSRTQESWFGKSEGYLYSECVMVKRLVHVDHGGRVTNMTDPDTDDRTKGMIALAEKIENQIREIIWNVVKKTKENEIVGDDLEKELENCVRHLYSLRLSPNQIHLMTVEKKELSRHNAFIPITHFLYKNGLNGRRTCKLVTMFPEVLDIPKDVISEKIENLRELGFISPDILLVIEGLPEVLQMPMKAVQRRISDLEKLFKTKDVLDLIKKSPSILTEDLDVIKKKFDYVFHEMGITQRQIMYSSLFKHSLSHIRQRHVFLVRAGFYKKRVKKGEINPNPILEDIVDISTRAFLKKYGNMTMSDYVAFCELFEREAAEVQDDGEEEGDDSDDDKSSGWKR
ncbi:transcription termination factor 4, mitochondrial-like [Ylistrum balloti]|uniref:transcription termination factor 4, mitochondrial-like n=1 Tax=Ylistrum balloti TaxID=509963 RepID=UPI002905CC04|nr:transcription termination factor 4, mitochondrial-like [Ylistrum balloti]